MHVLVLGAAGMVGRKLVERLARDGALGDRAVAHAVAHEGVDAAAVRPVEVGECLVDGVRLGFVWDRCQSSDRRLREHVTSFTG